MITMKLIAKGNTAHNKTVNMTESNFFLCTLKVKIISPIHIQPNNKIPN